jgi:protocatechuate 3,4-dioxygenase beta subunit
MKQRITRRKLLRTTTALAGGTMLSATVSGKTVSAMLTPGAAEGPFYPTESMRTEDTDNDLVKVAGMVKEAGGEIITLQGKVLSKDGSPRVGQRVEIWQCDVNGKYLHSGDRRDVAYDTGFQGFGYDITDNTGGYRFRTIKPARYPGRTPHIHVKVCEGERELLTTQFYIDGEADNERDGLYRRMSEEQARRVSMVFTEADGAVETSVDIIV